MYSALILAMFIFVPLVVRGDTLEFPGIWEGPVPWVNISSPSTKDIDAKHYQRTTMYFPCKAETCEAWFYLPKNNPCSNPPVVVIAHGIGGQKDMSLHLYAARYAEDGFASFVFDYRSFGGSSGEPRLWVSPKRHLQDWDEALTYLKEHLSDKVDVQRIGIWGTSFSGGHVIEVAAKWGKDIKAVVSQPLARAAASIELWFNPYSPIDVLPKVQAPIHFMAAPRDSLCSFRVQQMALHLAKNATLLTMDINHFQPYLSPWRETIVDSQAAFLSSILNPKECPNRGSMSSSSSSNDNNSH